MKAIAAVSSVVLLVAVTAPPSLLLAPAAEAVGNSSSSQPPGSAPPGAASSPKTMPGSAAATQSSLSKADRSFAEKAGEAGLAEVAEAQIALQKSNNQQVKDFAQHMVTDHSKANEALKAIASQEGVTLPSEPNATHKREAAALQKLSSAEFDKRYVNDQKSAHKAAVALFDTESKSGKNPALRSFAAQTLPTLQEHSQMIGSISTAKTSSTQ